MPATNRVPTEEQRRGIVIEATMLQVPRNEERRCGGRNGEGMKVAGPPSADLAKRRGGF